MPEQVTKEWFEKAGLSPNLANRNLQALRYLGLVDPEGYTTAAADRLRTASSEEYAGVLEEVIRKAYAPIFKFTNPSEDSRKRVEDAFRREEPSAQRGRMVTCFLGLCAIAGIPLKEAPPTRGPSAAGAARGRAARAAGGRLEPQKGGGEPPPPPTDPTPAGLPPAYDPILGNLLQAVPTIETIEELDDWWGLFRPAFAFVKNRKKRNGP